MRYQFFLDARDYLKYGLLEDLASGFHLRRLTIVWMLTPDVSNGHGQRPPQIDPARPALNSFFSRRPAPVLGDVATYFSDRGLETLAYGDTPAEYLSRTNRAAYFAEVPDHGLSNRLVFLDPDNGVEPRSGASPAHVRLSEMAELWDRMDSGSALVVYQHKPRVAASRFWPQVAGRVGAALSTEVAWVPFGDVGFLVAHHSSDLRGLRRGLPALSFV